MPPGLEFLLSGCVPLAIAAARYCLRGPVLAGGSLFTPSLSVHSFPFSSTLCGTCCFLFLPLLRCARGWACFSLSFSLYILGLPFSAPLLAFTTCLLSLCTVFWCLQALLMIKFVFGFCSLCSFVMILKSATPLS